MTGDELNFPADFFDDKVCDGCGSKNRYFANIHNQKHDANCSKIEEWLNRSLFGKPSNLWPGWRWKKNDEC